MKLHKMIIISNILIFIVIHVTGCDSGDDDSNNINKGNPIYDEDARDDLYANIYCNPEYTEFYSPYLCEYFSNKSERTELIDAVLRRNPEEVNAIINKGVDVNYKNINGYSALDMAIILNQPDVVKILINAGAT